MKNETIRCKKCFVNHYPYPKLCKQMDRKNKMGENNERELSFNSKSRGGKWISNSVHDMIKNKIQFLELMRKDLKSIQDYYGSYTDGKLYFEKSRKEMNKGLKIKKESPWPYRLRGGADGDKSVEQSLLNVEESVKPMINKAIANAASHGISLHHGVGNLANGNCAFESVIDNISTRSCFGETYNGTPDYYRYAWMSEIERIAFDDWNSGLSKDEWKESWGVLKQSRVHEHNFGDLIIPGIAHCTKKNILIFNTSPMAHSPAYAIAASTFGGSSNTDIPVCLAYDQSHYESLVPNSETDIQKTIDLMEKVISGEYHPMRISSFHEDQLKTTSSKEEYEKIFPSLGSQKKTGNENRVSKFNTKQSTIDITKSPTRKKTKDNRRYCVLSRSRRT